MDLDSRYSLVRDKLYTLGFDQPLPIGSLGLVTALLDDLVKTTSNLKATKDENKQLLEVHINCFLILKIFFNFFQIVGKSCMGSRN